MAVSQYYGQTGSTVKDWQKVLNEMGAGLKVDGIWGDKTEAAYNSLLGGSSGSPSSSSSGGTSYSSGGSLTVLGGSTPSSAYGSIPGTALAYGQGLGITLSQVNRLSDEELRRIAELSGRESYDLEVNQLQSKYDRDLNDLQTQRSRVEEDYGDTARAIEEAFAGKRDELSDYALSRGMGRSSYALDMQNRAYDEERASLLGALQEKQRSIEDIDNDIAVLGQVLAEGKDKLSRQRMDDIEAMVDKLRYEQEKAAIEAERYNNTLLLQLENARMDAINAALAASSGSTGSSGGLVRSGSSSSSSKKSSSSSGTSKKSSSSSSSYEQQALNEWNKLTNSGKMKYFTDNAPEIRLNSNDLYQAFKREYDEIKEYTKPSSSKDYGYYKNQSTKSHNMGGR